MNSPLEERKVRLRGLPSDTSVRSDRFEMAEARSFGRATVRRRPKDRRGAPSG